MMSKDLPMLQNGNRLATLGNANSQKKPPSLLLCEKVQIPLPQHQCARGPRRAGATASWLTGSIEVFRRLDDMERGQHCQEVVVMPKLSERGSC